MRVGDGRHLAQKAWQIILTAGSDPSAHTIRRLTEAREQLTSIVQDPQLMRTHEGAYLHSRLTLGSLGVMQSVVEGEWASAAVLEEQRTSMASFMHDMTSGEYDLQRMDDHTADAVACAAAMGIVARRGTAEEGVVYPSPPGMWHGHFRDSNNPPYHLMGRTRSGFTPIFLSRTLPVFEYQPEAVLKLQLGEVLYAAAGQGKVESITAIHQREQRPLDGRRALIHQAVAYLATEVPPRPSGQPTSDEDIWLRQASGLLTKVCEGFQ